MSDKPDLATTEGVLEWARTANVFDDGNPMLRPPAPDTATADYIADAVRLYEQLATEGMYQTGGHSTRRAWSRIAENERLRKEVDGFGKDFGCAYAGSNSYEQGRDRTLFILHAAMTAK